MGRLAYVKADERLRCLYAWCGDQVASPHEARLPHRQGDDLRDGAHESETLLGSKLQLTQAMLAVSAVVSVAQCVTTATSAL